MEGARGSQTTLVLGPQRRVFAWPPPSQGSRGLSEPKEASKTDDADFSSTGMWDPSLLLQDETDAGSNSLLDWQQLW